MKLHPYIPPINATVRTIDGLIGTVERVDQHRDIQYHYDHMGTSKGIVWIGPWEGAAVIAIGKEHKTVSIYNIRPCIRE